MDSLTIAKNIAAEDSQTWLKRNQTWSLEEDLKKNEIVPTITFIHGLQLNLYEIKEF